MIKRIDGCKNNYENFFHVKVDEHNSCLYSVPLIGRFSVTENKDDVYRDEDIMKKFWGYLRGHTIDIINFKKSKTIPLTNEK